MNDSDQTSTKTRSQATIELLKAHRSIRQYKDTPVPEGDIEAAVRAGQAASTSSAVQACTIIQVTRPEERAALVPLTGGQQKVADCGAFFLICADARRHRLLVQREGQTYNAQFEAFLVAVIDAALFGQNMTIAFEAMGYGMCYIGGLRIDLNAVRTLLEIPKGVYPLYGLCVGVPDQQPAARPRLPLEAVFCRDRYPGDAEMLALIDEYDSTYREHLRERGASDEAMERAWSAVMARKFAAPDRTGVAAFYRQQGADFT